jgi:hypothetical protein
VFRVPFYIAVVLLISFGGGIAATLAALKYTTSYGAVTIGAWRAFPLGQTLEADPYTKSHRANAGRLLYGTAEGLSFTANVDSLGEKLSRACDYKITGNLPIARFWTLFTAGPDGRLTTTDDVRPLALNSRILLRDPNGGLDIDLSREARPFNWLAMQNIPNLTLVLNLFDTPIASSTGLIDIEMPTITKIGCGNV